ncbi:Trk system potassium transporter TrkA [Anoxynatronum buryatiense]|uniref:Trk system potassium uptake protein TrkA n=1 Tax=Anoxynatronum buryatiense TaxID=489973 RepID=A0AA45WTC7_9CLOT|nr:Trk system potassium transporter TrkA [Anoxynatronum buryatiense]SMP40807.1 trk system potassium uptake protein TrkA [Anoxynatronum buryatiense]
MKVLIVGMGKLGYQLAEAFAIKDNDVVVMDQKQSALQKTADQLDVLAIQHNGVEITSLKKANIGELDLTIAVTDDDETNILIAFLSKRMGCQRSIARVRNPEYSRQSDFIKEEMNIDYIVNPEQTTAQEIRNYLLRDMSMHVEDFAQGRIVMADVHVNHMCNIAGYQLKDLNIREKVLVAAIVREGDILIPHGETLIEETDVLYLIGESEDVASFSGRCGVSTDKKEVDHVVILGGGRIGYYLTEYLVDLGMNIKIIESNRERCKYLAETFGNVLVINGDGTDINLLKEEGVFGADALICLTGLDEENLLLALLAKQFGMKHVISKVSRPNYIPIIEKLGVDVAVNPVTITASEILRYVLGGKVASISLLLGGSAEALEIVIKPEAYVTRDQLQYLELPKGIIIGAVLRGDDVLIPDGTTHIQPEDRIVVFILSGEMSRIEEYFYPPRRGFLSELWNYR